ncbi:hypothetical protein [Asticcacaulis benevestitus]|nr:hypothetical protein [Asticcacaulis benevestitus]
MGEAKRRRLSVEKAACLCGSGRAAKTCCLTGAGWRRMPARLGLHALSAGQALNKCYMNALGSCEGKISGEHLISESVMDILSSEGEFTISGTPWLKPNEVKAVGFKSLTANCLCQRHNSALSPLDAAAKDFFSALKSNFEGNSGTVDSLISGHDIERWLLKTLKALAVSRNLAIDNERIAGEFASDIRLLDLLDDPTSWPDGTGLYCIMKPGDLTENHSRFQIAPLTTDSGSLRGLATNMLGLHFLLLLEPLDRARNPDFSLAVFRPGEIIVRHPTARCRIVISWSDGAVHDGSLTLEPVQDSVS